MLLKYLPKYLLWLQERGYIPYSLEAIQVDRVDRGPWYPAICIHHADGRHKDGGCDFLVVLAEGSGKEHYASVSIVPYVEGDQNPLELSETQMITWGDEPSVVIRPEQADWGAQIAAVA